MGPSTSAMMAENEEFERRKQEWQDELEEMSEFLYIKSATEQKEEGVNQPVDTATIEDIDGLPYLKAVFDVKYFRKEDITMQIVDDTLVLQARTTEDKDDRVYTRTIVRKLDLPKYVDTKMTHSEFKNGLLLIEMPFHMPPQRRPQGPNVFPIITDKDGRRKLRLMVYVGVDFTSDDIHIDTNGKSIKIRAAYDEEIGKYGKQVTAHEFNREYLLPEYIEVDEVVSKLAPDGRLFIELYLKDEKPFRCTVQTEEIENDVDGDE